MLDTKKKQGFTIIEVVIVLVIGAIIMLMVFLVVPYLQRTQRDSRRQNDARKLLTAVEQYKANNNGQPPTTQAQLVGPYIQETFNDPSTNQAYVVTVTTGASPAVTAANAMTVSTGSATCATSGGAIVAPPSGQAGGAAVSVRQENGTSICIQG